MIELIINELKGNGVAGSNIIYINFENLDYEDIDDCKRLNEFINNKRGKAKQYLFFDEIQHVKSFEKAINLFRVSFDCSIFITGSNSKMLSTEISTLLTGRIIEILIYPFSFYESEMYRKANNKLMEDSFYDYLELGGYPLRFDLMNKNDIKNYLRELYNNICIKDIFIRNSKIEKEKFNRIAKYILSNAGNDFNPEVV